MTLHVRDFTVEFEAEDEDVSVVVAGLIETVDRRLTAEAELGRIREPSVTLIRDVARA